MNSANDTIYDRLVAMQTQQSVGLKEESQFSGIIKFHDPLIMMNNPDFLKRSNPITEKYYILTRDVDDSIAKDLRPDSEELEELNKIIALPDFQTLNIEEKAKIWHFRYSLIDNKKALVKFLQCIDWNKEKEEQEGMRLLKKWAEIDFEQALPLLSFMFCANSIYGNQTMAPQIIKRFSEIRALAVNCLERQSCEKINSIMLQLVQAYRYENFQSSALRKFLLSKAVSDENLANTFHWHVKLEKENDDNKEMMGKYIDLYEDFFDRLEQENPVVADNIKRQIEFRNELFQLAEHIKKNKKEKNVVKNQTLKKVISRGGEFDMSQFDRPRPMPINPHIYVRGIEPSKCFVFKSAMCPLKLSFYAQHGEDKKTKDTFLYSVMYKHGDDVR